MAAANPPISAGSPSSRPGEDDDARRPGPRRVRLPPSSDESAPAGAVFRGIRRLTRRRRRPRPRHRGQPRGVHAPAHPHGADRSGDRPRRRRRRRGQDHAQGGERASGSGPCARHDADPRRLPRHAERPAPARGDRPQDPGRAEVRRVGGGERERGDQPSSSSRRARTRRTRTSSSGGTTSSSSATACCARSWATRGDSIPRLDAADDHRRARPLARGHGGDGEEPAIALVTEVGTRTSHTSIMARALEIPAVVGVEEALYHVRTGDMLIVDGLRGEITVRPSEIAIAERDGASRPPPRVRARAPLDARPARASRRDGVSVALRANVELPAEAILALDHGADGIGLYRTEFLYIDRTDAARRERAVRALPGGHRGGRATTRSRCARSTSAATSSPARSSSPPR